MDLSKEELDVILNGEYELEHHPEIVREKEIHEILMGLEVDELHHHLKNPQLMLKFTQAQRSVLSDIKAGLPWGSIYDK